MNGMQSCHNPEYISPNKHTIRIFCLCLQYPALPVLGVGVGGWGGQRRLWWKNERAPFIYRLTIRHQGHASAESLPVPDPLVVWVIVSKYKSEQADRDRWHADKLLSVPTLITGPWNCYYSRQANSKEEKQCSWSILTILVIKVTAAPRRRCGSAVLLGRRIKVTRINNWWYI